MLALRGRTCEYPIKTTLVWGHVCAIAVSAFIVACVPAPEEGAYGASNAGYCTDSNVAPCCFAITKSASEPMTPVPGNSVEARATIIWTGGQEAAPAAIIVAVVSWMFGTVPANVRLPERPGVVVSGDPPPGNAEGP
jgi:hypothetical protein